MNTELDLENELFQLFVEEAVRAGLETPLREPILAAVGDASGSSTEPLDQQDGASGEPDEQESDDSDAVEKSAVTKATQGLVVFVVMFTVLYVTLRRLTGDDGA